MKRILWMLLCAPIVLVSITFHVSYSGGIVNNNGDGSEDSVVVSVVNWDSAGCSPVSADSFWVVVFKAGTDEVCFRDSGTATMEGLDTVLAAGKPIYYFHRSVSDIDGDGSTGPYCGKLIAKNVALGLFNCATFEFQVVGWELDEMGDSASTAGRLCDSAVVKAGIVDSLFAALDTLQNHDDWVSRFDPAADSVLLNADEFTAMADTIFGRDSNLYDEGYWHKIATRADSGATTDGPDSVSVARWVWNTPAGNHDGEGTFGGNLDARISGIGTGSGVYACLLVAYDSTVGQVIPSVSIVVRNLNQTSLVAVGMTDTFGLTSFNLDEGTYLAIAKAAGYSFESYDTIVVSGNAVDTVFGEQFDPGAPAQAELCRVYGHLYNLTGSPEAGINVMAAIPSGVVRFEDVIVSPTTVAATTDQDGYFHLDLIPSARLTPSGTQYEFTVSRSDGTFLRQRAVVPDAENWCLTW